jgi:hypothetical protein
MRTLLFLASASLSLLGVSCAQELEYHTPDRSPVTPTEEPVRDASTPIMQEGPYRPGSDAGVLGPAVTLPEASVRDAGPRDAAADADARVDARVDAATDAGADADAEEPDADADTAPPWIMPFGEQRGPVSLTGMCPNPDPAPPAPTTCRAWPWHTPPCYRAPIECAALHESTYCLSVYEGGSAVFTGLDTGASCVLEFFPEYPLAANDGMMAQLGPDVFTTNLGVVTKHSLVDGSFDVASPMAGAVFVMGQQLVIVAPDGRLLAYPSWSDLKLDRNERSLGTVSPALGAVFGANSTTVVAAWNSGRIDLFTPGVSARVVRIQDFRPEEDRILGVDLSEDGTQIQLLTSQGVWTLEANTGRTLRRLATSLLNGLSCSPGLKPGEGVTPVPGDPRPGFYYGPERDERAILASSDCAGPFNGPRYYGQTGGPELLVLATYFNNANVVTDERTTPHTLVLTSINGAEWTVRVAAGAKLERILVNGASATTLALVSSTPIPVEYHLDQGSAASFGNAAGTWPAPDQAELQTNLEAYTGRPLTEFLGCFFGSTYAVRDVPPLCTP